MDKKRLYESIMRNILSSIKNTVYESNDVKSLIIKNDLSDDTSINWHEKQITSTVNNLYHYKTFDFSHLKYLFNDFYDEDDNKYEEEYLNDYFCDKYGDYYFNDPIYVVYVDYLKYDMEEIFYKPTYYKVYAEPIDNNGKVSKNATRLYIRYGNFSTTITKLNIEDINGKAVIYNEGAFLIADELLAKNIVYELGKLIPSAYDIANTILKKLNVKFYEIK